jgi:hypothetical protein
VLFEWTAFKNRSALECDTLFFKKLLKKAAGVKGEVIGNNAISALFRLCLGYDQFKGTIIFNESRFHTRLFYFHFVRENPFDPYFSRLRPIKAKSNGIMQLASSGLSG